MKSNGSAFENFNFPRVVAIFDHSMGRTQVVLLGGQTPRETEVLLFRQRAHAVIGDRIEHRRILANRAGHRDGDARMV